MNNRAKSSGSNKSVNNLGLAGAGGVFRDHEGKWIIGFAKNLCFGLNNECEFWALKQDCKFLWPKNGLEIALSLWFRKVEIETDSKFAVNTLNGIFTTNVSHKSLIKFYISLILQFEENSLMHAFPRSKWCGNALAHQKKNLLFLFICSHFLCFQFFHELGSCTVPPTW
ncbi:hypothetical protein SLE2022_387580 [Rubroshorea leprosula]